MIEEILSEIRKAEDKASDIVADAEARAEKIRVDADNGAAAITEKAVSDAKNYRVASLDSAEREAALETLKSDVATQKECDELKERYAQKANAVAKDIFRRVKDGNC